VTDTPEVVARRLVDDLTQRGAASERMAAALRAVPRHLFIPDLIYRHDRGRAGNDLVPVHRGQQPEQWLRLVYADEAVNTQVDDGQPGQDGTGWEVTSSSSQPSVVAGMLDELRPDPGQRVLEIGTGWHAALLAHLLGPENVTSIEVDSTVADRARAALDSAGYGKTNVVRREAPCRIPDSVGRDLEDSSWVRWLTLSRKATGTRACHEYRRSCPDVRNGVSGNPRDRAKPELAESQSPAMQLFIHRKLRLKPVPRSVSVYFVGGCNLQGVGRCPVRTFKGMSGTPKSCYYVRQGRTRDRLRDASPMVTECS
jgi:protein-L-isoaspartate O-methyltransferase